MVCYHTQDEKMEKDDGMSNRVVSGGVVGTITYYYLLYTNKNETMSSPMVGAVVLAWCWRDDPQVVLQ